MAQSSAAGAAANAAVSIHGGSLPSKKRNRFFGTSATPAGQLGKKTPQPQETPVASPGRSSHRRDSSLTSLTDFGSLGSSLRRRSASLRGQGALSPEQDKLAPVKSRELNSSASQRANGAPPPSRGQDSFKSTPAISDVINSPITQGVPPLALERVRDQASKRISTLDYLRKAHEGRIYWFNTLFFSRNDFYRLPYFERQKLSRRATNFFILGNSITGVLDPNSNSLLEYLRMFSAILKEFDRYQEFHPIEGSSSSRVKVPHVFKRSTIGGGKGRRSSGNSDIGSFHGDDGSESRHISIISTAPIHSFPGPDRELLPGEEYHYLLTPPLPFDPDYFETFATLCDVLIDCYATILGLVSGPEVLNAVGADLFLRVDDKVKKVLLQGLVRDFETSSKQGIRSELAGVGKVVLGGLV